MKNTDLILDQKPIQTTLYGRMKYLENLLEKRNTYGIICVRYNCNALQFWSGRKLFGPPQAGRISRHFYYEGKFWRGNEID